MIWSLVAAGNVADGAGDQLRLSLAELLGTPEFGTGHTSLVIGPGPAVSGLHVPEPAIA